ncbi:MAG: EpsG family protein, partial [Treponema sp.]|nr:EpsG family protein [Treponema sp.]
FRWLTGSDWNAYYPYFNDLNTWKEFNNGTFEITYTLLNFIVKCFSSKFTSFLIVLAFLCVSLKMKLINKISSYPAVCLFLYYCYCVADIFAVRQSLAISILMYSILFIRNKDKTRFILLTLLATSIHNTSIIWLVTYKLYWRHIKETKIFLIFSFCFVIGLISGKFYAFVIPIITAPFSSKFRVVGKLLVYATGYASSDFSVSTVFSLIKRMLFLPIFLSVHNKIPQNKTYEGLFNIWMIGTCIYLLFSNSLNVFQRMTTPFILVEFLLLPYVLKVEKKSYLKPILYFFICGYAISKLINALNVYPDLYIPYYSIFYYEPRVMY